MPETSSTKILSDAKVKSSFTQDNSSSRITETNKTNSKNIYSHINKTFKLSAIPFNFKCLRPVAPESTPKFSKLPTIRNSPASSSQTSPLHVSKAPP